MSEPAVARIKELLRTVEPAALGPQSRPGVLSEAALNAKLDACFREAGLPVRHQQLVRALLLLWHDHLDASHTLSQGIEDADGSFVHALMHRREPDAWNSKYWWRRTGHHPVFPEIARRVGEFLERSQRREEAKLMRRLVPDGQWDAAAFVDVCDAAKDESLIRALREIQRIEIEVLLEFFCHE